jgi:putative DNA primase/helicase
MTRQESNNTQTDLADLRGARFVMTSETEQGQRLAEGKLKRITQGMGRIKAVRKYENPIEFAETHKLFIDANHKPVVRGTDNAIWNRLYPIPFDVTIPPDEIDRDLPNKLLAESEGILVWAVRGAVRWYREGLRRPPEVAEANREWRDESDHLGRFLEERCVSGDAFSVKAGVLYSDYRTWCASSGERELSSVAFGIRLGERGIQKGTRGSTGYRYLGVALRAEE